MDSIAETGGLARYPGRSAGTDAERRAANHLHRELEVIGREAHVRTLSIRPRWGLTHALHCLLGIAGSVVSVGSPAAGGALLLAAALSTVLDATGLFQVVRRGTGSRASQNVEAPRDTGRPGLLVVTAQVDAPRRSGAFGLAVRFFRDPWLVLLLALVGLLALAVLRLLGLEGGAVTGPQFAATVVLILLAPAFADVELTGAGTDEPGAAAAEVALGLAEELEGELEHFDVGVLFTGAAEPFALGMRAWLRANRPSLEAERTAVVSVGRLGSGPVRFTTREGAVLALRCHSELVRICREIAEDDGEGGAYAATSTVARRQTPAAAALARGLPAITISCDGTQPDDDSIDRTLGFCRELAERLDAEVGPTLEED